MEQAEKKFSKNIYSGSGPSFRRINHISQQKTRFTSYIPENSSGVDGDIVYYRNPSNLNKIEQYIKHDGEWINLSSGRPTSDSPIIRKFVKAKTV